LTNETSVALTNLEVFFLGCIGLLSLLLLGSLLWYWFVTIIKGDDLNE